MVQINVIAEHFVVDVVNFVFSTCVWSFTEFQTICRNPTNREVKMVIRVARKINREVNRKELTS